MKRWFYACYRARRRAGRSTLSGGGQALLWALARKLFDRSAR